MASCNVQIFNATSNTIARAAVLHSTTLVTLATDFTNIGSVANLAGDGTASETFVASQSSWGGDYWTAMIQFVDDPVTYIVTNDVVPICECNVPDNGSCSFVISDGNGQYNIQINTYKGSNWTDADGTCNEQMTNIADDSSASDLIKAIIDMFEE